MNWKNLLTNPPCSDCNMAVKYVSHGEHSYHIGRFIKSDNAFQLFGQTLELNLCRQLSAIRGREFYYINLDEIVG